MNVVFKQFANAFSARREARASSQGEVRLAVMVARDAVPQTGAALRQALYPQTASCRLYVAGFGGAQAVLAVNSLSDAAVVAAGLDAQAAAGVYGAYSAAGVPCCVAVCVDAGPEGIEELVEAGVPWTALLPGDEARLAGALGMWLVGALPEQAGALSAGFACCRRARALAVAGEAARNNALVGAVPVFDRADLPVMMATEAAMAFKIADAYGLELGAPRAKELAALAGGAFALRGAARFLVGRLPLPAFLLKTLVAGFGTYALGRGLMAYYGHLAAARAPRAVPTEVVSVEPAGFASPIESAPRGAAYNPTPAEARTAD